MKKIVALGVAAALVGGLAFAGEPASNPSVVSFTGNASVEWGVDLDAGKTGFKNDTWTELKLKLFDAGEKSTSADGDIWAELKVKVDDDSSVGPNGYKDGAWLGFADANFDKKEGGKWNGKKAYIDVAKLHFGNVYVGIKSGDTVTGDLDFTTAIKSADPWFHPGRWLQNVGPDKFTQGIVAGYEDDNMDIAADFRSYEDGQYTDAYAVAAEFKLKDSNSFAEGLSAGVGASYNLADKHFKDSKSGNKADEVKKFDLGYFYNDKDKNNKKDDGEALMYSHLLGYSANVGYKLKIDDTYWLKPQVGLTGWFATDEDADAKTSWQANCNTLAAGVMFGWGNTASYGGTGLYYMDYEDRDKGTTPGISAMVYMPLPLTVTNTQEYAGTKYTGKSTIHQDIVALIVPSVYSGDLVENLKFAAYSEMGLFDYRETQPAPVTSGTTTTSESYAQTKDGKNTFALGLVAGLKYDIKVDELTITPKASVRYANSCYVANNEAINKAVPGGKTLFPTGNDGLGIQKKGDGERAELLGGDFFNLEAGVELAGLINNTTFSVHYKSANLMNLTEYADKTYNVKAGTLNVGCKIAF